MVTNVSIRMHADRLCKVNQEITRMAQRIGAGDTSIATLTAFKQLLEQFDACVQRFGQTINATKVS